ncbi:CAP domain-containing protein [Ornithinibacillus salinisoli]|uniref:CAP domain-containing protein n=1 Tax=Ornithinibacillus salinisoli TaxID=1848459 RepID=A0ABW4VXU1_9BACI
MRLLRSIITLVVIAITIFFFLDKNNVIPREAIDHITLVLDEKKHDVPTKKIPEKIRTDQKLAGDLFHWIGRETDELIEKYGEPERKDRSAYDYEWWVYSNAETKYMQFGVIDNEIKTIFATGTELEIEPFVIGDTYESIDKVLSFSDEVTYNKGLSSYTFQLNDEDVNRRPLAKVTDDLFIQSYFDTFTNRLSSIRILSGDILLQHRPYALQYRGNLPESPDFSEKEWHTIESGMEKQIFDISNVIRQSNEKSLLSWDDTVHEVAYLHSKDMYENNYFSHYGLNGEGLKERLADKDVYYFAAGENIAAQYVDAPAAVEGWLNSEGHREALLSSKYTHLGVGVFRFYYTQNFLTKP